ncbi:MAG: hypothetical protein A4E66_02430 [Syntrophus sp. PtaB.Bin001]|nr:MAG: hypothetical protein A4E66_02430 [Syntrophus sp. PtaB.Bin001]
MDAETGGKAEDCRQDDNNGHQQGSRVHVPEPEYVLIEGDSGGGYSQQDRKRRDQLQDRIGLRDVGSRVELRDRAVQGRTEEGGLQPHQKEHRQDAVPVRRNHPGRADQRRRQLQGLGPDHHFFLGKMICHPSGGRGEEDERQGEKDGGCALQII